jgi:hypothetical protein
MAAARALRATIEVASKAAVELVAVKGAVTSFLLYDDVSERPLGDVDVRIRPTDRVALRDAARAAGFHVLADGGPYDNLTLAFGDIAVDVECHVGAPYMTALTVDDLLRTAVTVRHPLGFAVRVPDTAHHAFVLAVNCFKDKLADITPWAREDTRRIVLAPDFSVNRLTQVAHDARAHTLLYLVAEHFSGRAPTEPSSVVWNELRNALEKDARRGYLTAYHALEPWARDSALFRALTRVVSDWPLAWPFAFQRALAFERTRRRSQRDPRP